MKNKPKHKEFIEKWNDHVKWLGWLATEKNTEELHKIEVRLGEIIIEKANDLYGK